MLYSERARSTSPEMKPGGRCPVFLIFDMPLRDRLPLKSSMQVFPTYTKGFRIVVSSSSPSPISNVKMLQTVKAKKKIGKNRKRTFSTKCRKKLTLRKVTFFYCKKPPFFQYFHTAPSNRRFCCLTHLPQLMSPETHRTAATPSWSLVLARLLLVIEIIFRQLIAWLSTFQQNIKASF